jgi:hypothetical protein
LPTGKWKTEWGFFLPAKSTPDDSSSLTVDCFLCHAAKIDTLHHRFSPALDEDTQLVDADIKKMTDAMIDRILSDVDEMLQPFYELNAERAHEVVATMLDPRFACGSIVLDTITATIGNKDATLRMSASLVKQYRADVLINMLVNMDNTIEAAKHTPCADKESGVVASIGTVNDVDFMQMVDETHDTMAVEEREWDHRMMLVEDEWARYVIAAA